MSEYDPQVPAKIVDWTLNQDDARVLAKKTLVEMVGAHQHKSSVIVQYGRGLVVEVRGLCMCANPGMTGVQSGVKFCLVCGMPS